MPTRVSLMRRRLKPCASAARISASASAVSSAIVSKNASCTRRWPPRRAASASSRACRFTRRAMRFSPSGPVPHRVAAGDHRQQHLRGADVRCRLLAPDVLLARLQREPHRRLAGGIQRHADQPARHVALVGIARRQIAGVRTAEAHRHAEALRRTHHHIGAHLARRRQQRQRQRIGADDDQRVRLVRRADLRRQLADRAGGAGILQHQRERLRRGDRRQIAGRDIDHA